MRLFSCVCWTLCGVWTAFALGAVEAADYLGPTEVVASPDGMRVYILEADAGRIDVLATAEMKVVQQIPVPEQPNDMTLGPKGQRLFVSAGVSDGSVVEIDAATGKVLRRFDVGHTPGGLVVTPDGTKLFVCNRFDNDVSVIDLNSGTTIRRVKAVREPIEAAVSPDGSTVYVTNLLPLDRADSYDVSAEITWIDAGSGESGNIRLLNGTTGLRGITVSPDGKYVFAVHILARYQMPTTQLERGWMNTNAMTIIDTASRKPINTVLLDDVDLGAAVPHAVACTADGSKVCITTASTDELIVVDVPGMMEKLAALPTDPAAATIEYDGTRASFVASDVPNDLSFLVGLKQRMALSGGPLYAYTLESGDKPPIKGARGLAIVGNRVFVAVYYSDVLAVVDLAASPYERFSHIALGPTPEWTIERRGEVYFNDAALCFQHWQSCASCHPDARVDGLNWDLLNDGIGTPKNNKSLLFAHETPPSMWEGVRATAEEAVRSGIKHIQFAVRPEEDAQAIDAYLRSLRPVPSPYLVNGKLSEAAERGKALFFSERVGCYHCHHGPYYTDQRMHNVGSQGKYDRAVEFDTPTLIEVWRTAPYMHDGHYLTVEELIREGKHGARGGDIESLTDQELHDLCEFVRSL